MRWGDYLAGSEEVEHRLKSAIMNLEAGLAAAMPKVRFVPLSRRWCAKCAGLLYQTCQMSAFCALNHQNYGQSLGRYGLRLISRRSKRIHLFDQL